MKKLIVFLLLFSAVSLVAIQACNKDDGEPNEPPVANAGNDTALVLTTCNPKVKVSLDGRSSYDPENIVLSYVWKQISGPQRAFAGIDSTRELVYVFNLATGEYMFELEVVDWNGLSSKDSIIINITSPAEYAETELDVTGVFEFTDNYQDFYYPNIYYDLFSVNGSAVISNELFYYYFNETTDSAVVNTTFENFFNLTQAVGTTKSIYGKFSVDFESLYLKGGGNFEGRLTVVSGSAYLVCEDMVPETPPIIISGNLNAAAKSITMKIKGKIIF